jgi:hypothetical protein
MKLEQNVALIWRNDCVVFKAMSTFNEYCFLGKLGPINVIIIFFINIYEMYLFCLHSATRGLWISIHQAVTTDVNNIFASVKWSCESTLISWEPADCRWLFASRSSCQNASTSNLFSWNISSWISPQTCYWLLVIVFPHPCLVPWW